MARIIKKQIFSVTRSYKLDVDRYLLSKIYPEKSERDLNEFFRVFSDGLIPVEQIVEDAERMKLELNWKHFYDQWWEMENTQGDFVYDYEIKRSVTSDSNQFN
jgi:hypothetical protein